MRQLLLSRRWLPRHLLVVLMVATFLALGWWQLQRGEQGNLRSFAYALEWPAFAIFAVFGWWKLLRLEANPPEERRIGPDPDDRSPRAVGQAAGTGQRAAGVATPPAALASSRAAAAGDPDDEELAAYNRYLAWLNEQDRQQAR